MEFSPFNPIVKLCLQGMALEEQHKTEEAGQLFQQALDEATNNFERFLASYYIARLQTVPTDTLHWLEATLQLALSINDAAVKCAIPALYQRMSTCFKELGEQEKAMEMNRLAASFQMTAADNGPFYHGTKADLQTGDLLVAGGTSNYQSDLTMNHIYFTALVNGAGLAAALAKGEGKERVYIVEPTGEFESDPNLTNKKFPGNPSRSYRSAAPLKIVGEVTEWERQPEEVIQQFRDKLENNKGEIIN